MAKQSALKEHALTHVKVSLDNACFLWPFFSIPNKKIFKGKLFEILTTKRFAKQCMLSLPFHPLPNKEIFKCKLFEILTTTKWKKKDASLNFSNISVIDSPKVRYLNELPTAS